MSAVRDVFISSIQRDYAEIRAGAKRAVEALGKRAVMAEQGSDATSPQRSLLGEVAAADAVVLVLGPRYGDRGASGLSPTEEEYQEAMRRGVPVVVLVQEGERDPDQQDFIRRIGGSWEDGTRYSKFTGTEDIQAMVVEGLRRLDEAPATAETIAAAAARVDELASNRRPAGYGVEIALIAAPAISAPLLTAARLQDGATEALLISRARELGIFDQSEGVQAASSREGVQLSSHLGGGTARVVIGADGAASITLRSSDLGSNFAGSVIDPSVFGPSLEAALRFIASTWGAFDTRGDIHQAALVVVVHGADGANFGPLPTGNSISMPGFGRMPSPLLAPTSPLIVPANDIVASSTVESLMAEVRMPFAEVGALTSV